MLIFAVNMLQLDSNNLRTQKLHTLVENRTTFNLDCASLNLFETHQQAAEPRSDSFDWSQASKNLHFANDVGITQLIQRMVYLCAEDHTAKDIFIDMSLKELVIRLLEVESRQHHLLDPEGRATSQPITAAVAYILTHLDERLTIEDLSKMAYMSKSSFFRAFRNEMGISPIDFINGERIKLAVCLLKRKELSIRQIALRCGFNSASYFTRMFKKHYGVSPVSFLEKKSTRT